MRQFWQHTFFTSVIITCILHPINLAALFLPGMAASFLTLAQSPNPYPECPPNTDGIRVRLDNNFRIQGRDGAGNVSEGMDAETTYKPAALLTVSPPGVMRFQTKATPPLFSETLTVENKGGGTLAWVATTPVTQINLSQWQGVAPTTLLITVTYPPTLGVYTYPLTFIGPGRAYNSPLTVPITVFVVADVQRLYLPLILR